MLFSRDHGLFAAFFYTVYTRFLPVRRGLMLPEANSCDSKQPRENRMAMRVWYRVVIRVWYRVVFPYPVAKPTYLPKVVFFFSASPLVH